MSDTMQTRIEALAATARSAAWRVEAAERWVEVAERRAAAEAASASAASAARTAEASWAAVKAAEARWSAARAAASWAAEEEERSAGR